MLVRAVGLEPTRLTTQDPKSCLATAIMNYGSMSYQVFQKIMYNYNTTLRFSFEIEPCVL